MTTEQAMPSRDDDRPKFGAAATYNAAADSYDAEPLSFWTRYGQRTIDRLALPQGARVLDVCCGAGASAIPAAQAVGPAGHVTGVDVASRLLTLGRIEAARRDLTNIRFRHASMSGLDYPSESFDAVVCVFGIFFVANMEAQLTELWRLLRTGGKLAVTTWGSGLFEPASEIWRAEVYRKEPHLVSTTNPWDRITTPEAVRALFAGAGIMEVEVQPEPGYQVLRSPEDFWTIARGSGLRQTIEQLGKGVANDLRLELIKTLDRKAVKRVSTDVIYAIAKKTHSVTI